ncbi:MAG: pantetheine-phosphate adenylyltransferase [Candidatus Omnitrophota bacterium]
MKKNIAVYAGTFDPITYGHIDLIKRALRIFDRVIVAVAHNPAKGTLFSARERVIMIKKATSGLKNLSVEDFDGLLLDYVRKRGSSVIIRGLRMISDFEFEFQMALTNRKLNDTVETIFMMPNESFSYLSSRLIKEVVALGADVKKFVPAFVKSELKRKLLPLKKNKGGNGTCLS